MIRAASGCLVLSLALTAFIDQVKAVGICEYDKRTYVKQEGPVHFKLVRSGKYKNGYLGELPFYSKVLSDDICYLKEVAFRCVYADDGDISGTEIAVPDVTDVDAIFIDSTFPVTAHRIEKYVLNTVFQNRFIVEEGMRLTKCPDYKQTTLVWKFPGTVASRTTFECFRDYTMLCRGTTTINEDGKCVVKVEGENLIHTRVVTPNDNSIDFFYCRLDPATPRYVLTYNVDWRAAADIPAGGIPTDQKGAEMLPIKVTEKTESAPEDQAIKEPTEKQSATEEHAIKNTTENDSEDLAMQDKTEKDSAAEVLLINEPIRRRSVMGLGKFEPDTNTTSVDEEQQEIITETSTSFGRLLTEPGLTLMLLLYTVLAN
uniref:Uncharacterized protein n=1 Tax=Schistocephalus solidus TaxID=70667 RepID=A0A0X3PXL7_SCHSO